MINDKLKVRKRASVSNVDFFGRKIKYALPPC